MAYIKKEPLCAWLENMGVSDFVIRRIESEAHFPTADVEEVKHGEWILHPDGSATCNQCKTHQLLIWDMDRSQNYCGHCGADMRGGAE